MKRSSDVQHTPAPWIPWVDKDSAGVITQAGIDTADRSVNIAICVENLEPEDPANEAQLLADLNLIAMAPELLLSLIDMTPPEYGCHSRHSHHVFITEPTCRFCQLAELARSVIARAKSTKLPVKKVARKEKA